MSAAPFGSNFVTIKSRNKTWFNSKRTEVQDFIDSVKSQDNYYLQHKKLLRHLARFLIGIPIEITISYAIVLFTGPISIDNPPQFLVDFANITYQFRWLIYAWNSYIWGWLIADALFVRIDELWPKIEFNFGPAHLNKNAQKRRVITFATTAILLPILISLLFFALDKMTG